MTAPAAEPLLAGWAPSVDALGAQWSDLPAEARNGALVAAVRTLWALSGRRFGTVELTLAPFILPPHSGWYDGMRRPVTLNAARGYASGGLTACAPARTCRLPGPVDSVSEVVVDAAVLPTDSWNLDPDGTLVRVDGGDWPVAQDVYVPRFVVRYVRGIPADGPANTAAALYALELARGATADPKCKLPARVRDVSRQGISLSLATPEDLAESGGTGLPAVDVWLRAINPDGLTQPATIWSPNAARHRVIALHTPDPDA